MSSDTFTVEIVSPAGGVILSRQANHLRLPGVDGYFGILANHANLVAALGTGHLELDDASEHVVASMSGGYVQVKDGKVMILAESAELPSTLDLDRAKSARDRANEHINESGEGYDDVRARAALLRAINRIQLAERQHLGSF
jgi:F-type H+-transporting ATPase subunit epsilon